MVVVTSGRVNGAGRWGRAEFVPGGDTIHGGIPVSSFIGFVAGKYRGPLIQFISSNVFEKDTLFKILLKQLKGGAGSPVECDSLKTVGWIRLTISKRPLILHSTFSPAHAQLQFQLFLET